MNSAQQQLLYYMHILIEIIYSPNNVILLKIYGCKSVQSLFLFRWSHWLLLLVPALIPGGYDGEEVGFNLWQLLLLHGPSSPTAYIFVVLLATNPCDAFMLRWVSSCWVELLFLWLESKQLYPDELRSWRNILFLFQCLFASYSERKWLI